MPEPAVWFPTVRCHSGADVFTERLAAGLQQRGLRAEITWLPHRAEFAPWSVPVPKTPAWANIVHINSWLHPRFIAVSLPVVVTIHHVVHDDKRYAEHRTMAQRLYHSLWIQKLERANLLRAAKIVSHSNYTASRVKPVFNINTDITVVHSGVRTDVFVPAARELPKRPYKLLYVGSWSERKGVDILRPMLAKLGDDYLLYCVSDGKAKTALGKCRNFIFMGRIAFDKLVRMYQEADLLVFPTRLEGFGLVAAEAMACGVPVVSVRTSALPEVVEHLVTGWLCHNTDPEEFADACEAILCNPALWQEMRHASIARARALFHEEKMVDEYIQLYCSILKR